MENAKDIQDEVLDRLVASISSPRRRPKRRSPSHRPAPAEPAPRHEQLPAPGGLRPTRRLPRAPPHRNGRSAHPHHDRIGPATGRPERARRASLDDRADSWLRPRSAELAPRRHQHQLPPGIGCDPRQHTPVASSPSSEDGISGKAPSTAPFPRNGRLAPPSSHLSTPSPSIMPDSSRTPASAMIR